MYAFLRCLFILLYVITTPVHAQKSFVIYAFIPWNPQLHEPLWPGFLKEWRTHGLHPIKIIYEEQYLTQGKIDAHKLQHIAKQTALEPDIPVSFDMEFGNRFHPETVIPRMHQILVLYRSFHPKSALGIYGTIPQNTYAKDPKSSIYTKLNEAYKVLIADIDFISPVLYNYHGLDDEAWLESARYNMSVAKKYSAGKPIIPFISPIIRLGKTSLAKDGHWVIYLHETSMKKRLELLYALGASGCIMWTSSQDRTLTSQIPQFQPHEAWGKAVTAFIKSH